MRVLGLDIGSKRIGVAISGPLGITAQGIKVILRKSSVEAAEEISKIVEASNIEEIVVGLPINMNGTQGEGVAEVLKFVDILRDRVDRPIKMWDERLTTMEADRLLIASDVSRKKRKDVRDVMAAQLILQGYLACRKTNDDV